MTLGGERASVQNTMLRYAEEVGWQWVKKDDALLLRGNETSYIFRDIFAKQLKKLNPDFMDDLLINDIIKRFQLVPPNIQGNLIIWEHLKGLGTVSVQSERRERNVKLLDLENIDNNIFQVTDEFSFTNGTKTIRPDIVFLINGLPVIFVETKSAKKMEGIAEALDQVRRYHRETPELPAILQAYALTHLIKYYYSSTWNYSQKTLLNWRDETEGDYETLVKTFFDRQRIVKLLSDYILFTRQDEELKKVILRPHQIRAVEKIIERAESDKQHALIWHTQGSGKTYTMIVAAQKILQDPELKNPTVLMVVDRNELEAQLFSNLSSLGLTDAIEAESKDHLEELLSSDKRGLLVSMIHKFDDMPAVISERKNIFVLVDEAHRTTGGTLGNYLMGALPNATYIGFTGTPIDRTRYGQGTFLTFGKDDPPKGYLDKYSIAESIADGTTVPLRYSLAPNELQIDRQTLESEFLNLAGAEGVTDIEELNKVLEKATTLTTMLKNKERVEKVVRDIGEHFRSTVEPMGYKAFIVAVDREACALYKEELDRQGIVPPEYSKVVYSKAHNDEEMLERFYMSDEEEKQVRKQFIKPDALPKILIVTEKLLTGFDAPILYCMYLDKPMRDHVLLQTIARVNRPYEDEEGRKKPSGFVLDYVGIFDNLEKALSFDSSDISGVVQHIDRLKDEFAKMMDEGRVNYLVVLVGTREDKQVEAVIDHFFDEELREKFYTYFRNLQDLYEILSPSEFLRPYIKDFKLLANMYLVLRANYEPGISVSRELLRKTVTLVQEQTSSGPILEPTPVQEINEQTLEELEKRKKSPRGKVFDLRRGIGELVVKEGPQTPFLVSIGEKAEAVIARYLQRQIDTQEALNELEALVREINAAKAEQRALNMDADVFTTYFLFKKDSVPMADEKAEQISVVFKKFPHWRTSEKFERDVRNELYKVLKDAPVDDKVKLVNDTLRLLKRKS